MVRTSTFFVTALAALAPSASAAICNSGQEWCGSNLLAMGYAEQSIIDALLAYGLPTTTEWKNDSLFSCTSAAGSIGFLTFCGSGQCYISSRWGDSCPS
ncbi:hypothetical protein Micbo1qcDRAFT_236826 [Microdochium bolleyi]|uniref:Hydrophobin n=1 Tax=Microdochium bolleyi TaxID=196109 RepID=A0A136IPY4_9PEZI|nr:hypothetical protein Micbo1qcDRAFT_236826 [Microdochium bolleyi]